jgi:hypothetical protein
MSSPLVSARELPWGLPSPETRAIALTVNGAVLLIGGESADGNSTDAITAVNLSSGTTSEWGRLAVPTHDAAGFVVGSRLIIAGGGTTRTIDTVQSLRRGTRALITGHLPAPRSDASAVVIAGTAYVVGGYDGVRLDPAVLATRDGTTFRSIADLPVPVRYGAVTTVGNQILVIGGQTATGLADVIQLINPATHRARIIGRLPTPLADASANAIGSTVIVAGGLTPNGTSAGVLTCAPATGHCRRVASLPKPLANAAAVGSGTTVTLLGGERAGVPIADAIRLLKSGV